MVVNFEVAVVVLCIKSGSALCSSSILDLVVHSVVVAVCCSDCCNLLNVVSSSWVSLLTQTISS